LVQAHDSYALCPEEIVELDVTQAFDATYLWNTGSDQPVLEIKQPGEYSVTIFTLCQDLMEEVEIVIGEDCLPREIYIPNIFSPNGDGINDIFEISIHPEIEVNSVYGSVFDRWGNLLYESTGESFTWDGNSKNIPMMPGVYVIRFEIDYILNGVGYTEYRVVDVSLLR
jgi:gliding motility-associated-like protein